jgi:hypothetical protein
MSSPIYRCKKCNSIAHVVENNVDYYCAPCVIKRDRIPVTLSRNKKKKNKASLIN